METGIPHINAHLFLSSENKYNVCINKQYYDLPYNSFNTPQAKYNISSSGYSEQNKYIPGKSIHLYFVKVNSETNNG